ncbi:putative integral membrane protein [Babesia bovis T2Bo]|uniref:Uncharacterized protein n=1 Tax=Babesia bovis TaxID=5865 RepID=A7ATU2_BABBO|nr:putative integral membrane protein [Babesia bovis T2Bo]EDO06353.1 putative integral membrane protein [Babesia bovis T2Bo]|eukprot:XP_001609921.1 hypothetical protein [Babesia bovis T2Bo]
MGWFHGKHVYYMHSEVYLAFLSLVHLCCMILTGYGVFYHSRDLNELQTNMWAICILGITFLFNLCSTKCNNQFFRWFLPITILISLTCFFTLSVYHGIIVVFLVHLPVISFTLTGVPLVVLVGVCIVSVTLGLVFHMVLVASLYDDYHGYRSMTSITDNFTWFRPHTARAFTVVMLDTYILIIQIIVGVLSYYRFEKLGHLIGAYRSNPAIYLGSLESLRRLEEDFLPPDRTPESSIDASQRQLSKSLKSANSSDNSDSEGEMPWENSQVHTKRSSIEHIEPYHFQKSMQPGHSMLGADSNVDNQAHKSDTLSFDEIRKHYKPRPGGYVESLLKIASLDDTAPDQASLSSSSSVHIQIDNKETPTNVVNQPQAADHRASTTNGFSQPRRQKTRYIVQEPNEREKRSRFIETPSKRLFTAQQSKLIGSLISDDIVNRTHKFSKIDTLRQVSFSSYDTNNTDRFGLPMIPTTSKQWRESYDELRSMTKSLKSLQDTTVLNKILDDENARMRFYSFENPEHLQRPERGLRDSAVNPDHPMFILSPKSFHTSGCISQGTFNAPESSSVVHPVTASTTINTLISVLPEWCCRILLSSIRAINRHSHARELMKHYIWMQQPRSPATNSMGMFAHTRIEAWYVEWMHDFNVKFYTLTFTQTIAIFLLCVFSDLLVALRMYSTLESHAEVANFFSWLRIAILMLRYVIYPLLMCNSLWHMTNNSGKEHFSHYRLICLLCFFNIFLTFFDLWSCLGIFTTGYALHHSLHLASLITTTSLILFARLPTILCIYGVCILGYVLLLYLGSYKSGYSILEILTQMVVATGCMVFCVKPIEINRRNLFCLFTLPYLFYLEAMHS